MALSHSRDACLAPGGKFVVLFDSGKQQSELEQLRKEERLVKVLDSMHAPFSSLSLVICLGQP